MLMHPCICSLLMHLPHACATPVPPQFPLRFEHALQSRAHCTHQQQTQHNNNKTMRKKYNVNSPQQITHRCWCPTCRFPFRHITRFAPLFGEGKGSGIPASARPQCHTGHSGTAHFRSGRCARTPHIHYVQRQSDGETHGAMAVYDRRRVSYVNIA